MCSKKIDDAAQVLAAKFGEQVFRKLVCGLTVGGQSSCTGIDQDEGATWDITDAFKALRIGQPRVTEIWFIDRPAEHEQFTRRFPKSPQTPGVSELLGFEMLVRAIDVHDWRTDAFDPRTEVIASPFDNDVAALLRRGNMEKIVWPWICAIPGIWLHWSDGRYQMVLTEAGAI